MRKRKKDQQAVDSKIRNKIALKSKRQKSKDALKAPEKFIKQYRAQQKSYAHYRLKVKLSSSRIKKTADCRETLRAPMFPE
jgi:Tfp pilus assembly protein PilE